VWLRDKIGRIRFRVAMEASLRRLEREVTDPNGFAGAVDASRLHGRGAWSFELSRADRRALIAYGRGGASQDLARQFSVSAVRWMQLIWRHA